MAGEFLYIDCFSGVAGDMFVGALLDLAVGSRELLEQELAKIDIEGWSIAVDKVKVQGIHASRFIVGIRDEDQGPRSLASIESLIADSGLSEKVKSSCLAIFSRVARAEAEAHGESLETVHFHEIGMVDSIIDIVCACILIDQLAPSEIMASPVTTGSGTVETRHGAMPVPAPATAVLLRNIPIQHGIEKCELSTPTGAALVSYFAGSFGPLPPTKLRRIGYGAGAHKTTRGPNVLRLMTGELTGEPAGEAAVAGPGEKVEQQLLLETNIDDSSPEELGYLTARLLDAGAADAWMAPVTMKKGRPGAVLSVLCGEEELETFLDLIFTESSTFGIRAQTVERHCLSRRSQAVDTLYGGIRVKIGSWRGKTVSISPEFEDCRRAAAEHRVPLKEVYAAARAAAAGLL